jgi:hypothetical protein
MGVIFEIDDYDTFAPGTVISFGSLDYTSSNNSRTCISKILHTSCRRGNLTPYSSFSPNWRMLWLDGALAPCMPHISSCPWLVRWVWSIAHPWQRSLLPVEIPYMDIRCKLRGFTMQHPYQLLNRAKKCHVYVPVCAHVVYISEPQHS